MIDTIELVRIKTFPTQLEPGILYYSEEFEVAGHLCPCGCGTKVITPIEITEWSLSEEDGKPTLYPSLGNWQLPCRSHYWIRNGEIKWSYLWNQEEIKKGREAEDKRRNAYYSNRKRKNKNKKTIERLFKWFFKK